MNRLLDDSKQQGSKTFHDVDSLETELKPLQSIVVTSNYSKQITRLTFPCLSIAMTPTVSRECMDIVPESPVSDTPGREDSREIA